MGSPRRDELADLKWSIIEPLLPDKPRGVQRAVSIRRGPRMSDLTLDKMILAEAAKGN